MTQTATRARAVDLTADEVRAALAGTLTELRRVVKPQPSVGHFIVTWSHCPLGKPGDVLWVRESFRVHAGRDTRIEFCAGGVWEPADDAQRAYVCIIGTLPNTPAGIKQAVELMDGKNPRPLRRPSIHLPRWASRITLEVTGLRVEQVEGVWTWIAGVKRKD